MNKKVLIVGGVAGGASTAARLRRIDENCKIVMFEKGEYISFANCGLPYYIGGTITERSKLVVQTVEDMENKFNMDIRNFSEVTKINRDKKTVEVKNNKTGETYEEGYDVLVLSPGANPIKPPIPGINECDNLFTLRNIPDTDKIKSYVDNKKPRNAVVVGGGFIGLEMAENLVERGVNVTLVEMANQVMAPIDFEMAAAVHEHLRDKGVNLILEDGVNSFLDNGKKIKLNSGKEINSDLIILSIGVAPESKIAKEAGIKVNKRNAIIVDDHMKTSDESIYALGDAVEVKDYVTGDPTMIPLAWPANRQGRIVADNIAGRDAKYKGTLGSSVAKVFDLTVAATGLNEKILKAKNIEYKAIHIHPGSHAGYYPGAFPIHLKLIFSHKDGKILGAQAVGLDGVEKRIDVLATAIKGNLTVFDLPDVEACYAPPYSSAKDPVNMVGYYATNILDGLVDIVQWSEINSLVKNGKFILDVREPFEISLGTIENSVNIPLGQIRKRINEIPKDKTIYVYCQVGQRGYVACRMLSQLGYKTINIDGGYKTYALTKSINGDKGAAVVEEKETTNNNEVVNNMNTDLTKVAVTLDACGLQCPGPIRRVFEEMQNLNDGDIIEVRATDPGFAKDITSWSKNTGNTMLKSEFDKSKKAFVAYVQKGKVGTEAQSTIAEAAMQIENKNGSTMVVFSGDLDKAIASFIIATGAASMGKEVTMFFTFWGLNVLKKKDRPKVKKNVVEKMFDFMLPSNPGKLPLSKMNMGGMGPKMIKYIMKKNNVDTLEQLIENAIKMNVKVVACAMSMDLMGIKKEELIDGVEVAGVASYLGAADESGLNLFI